MVNSINHASFTVKSLKKSIDFYKDVIGLNLINVSCRDREFSEKVTGIKNAELKIAYLNAPNCSIELIEYISPVGKKIDTITNNIGSAHVCFIVSEFDQMVQILRDNNVKFSGDVCMIPGGPNKGKKVLYFEDPDNNTLEFISDKSF